MSGRLPNTVNLHVQTETKTECVVLVRACLNTFVCLCALSADVSVCTSHLCAYACPFLCMCVCLSSCTFVPFARIHGDEYLNVMSMLERTPSLAWECDCTCVVRACKTDTRVFCGFICELWTSWVHTGGRPIYIVYLSLYTMTGMAQRVYSLFSAASRPGK